MNWNTVIRDAGRVIVGWSIVGCWLYFMSTNNPAMDTLTPVAVAVIATLLGVDGILKYLEGKGNGRYITKE